MVILAALALIQEDLELIKEALERTTLEDLERTTQEDLERTTPEASEITLEALERTTLEALVLIQEALEQTLLVVSVQVLPQQLQPTILKRSRNRLSALPIPQ